MVHGNFSSVKSLGISLAYWVFVSIFYLTIRYGHAELLPFDDFYPNALYIVKRGLAFGGAFGFALYFIKELVAQRNLNHISYGKLILYRNLTYIALVLFLLFVFVMVTTFNVYGLIDRTEIKKELFSAQTLISVFAFLVFAGIFDLLNQISHKFGPNNLWKMIIGTYHKPQEEEKIFMFLDLQSSTTIAEKIGHRNYSEFLQECFKDIAIISDYGGEVYQYVGDEAVFTWNAKDNRTKMQCIKAFYAFQDRIKSKSNQYQNRFGYVPLFKAGLHGGVVMVAEVGTQKKEIAFHGDPINTAARIQAMCNEKERIFLVSEYFADTNQDENNVILEDMGEMILKGKNASTRLFFPELRMVS